MPTKEYQDTYRTIKGKRYIQVSELYLDDDGNTCEIETKEDKEKALAQYSKTHSNIIAQKYYSNGFSAYRIYQQI